MEKIRLKAIPNQTLSCTLGGKLFDITVQLGPSGGTLLSVAVAGKEIVSTRLAVKGGQALISPYNKQFGNMVWICEDSDSYPVYTKFDTTHGLYWWPYEE